MNAPEIAGLTDFQLLGEGSTFVTWKARQASLDRDVEVRQLSQALPEKLVAHHIRMAKLLAKLNHGAIAQVYDVNAEATPPFILAEHAAAPSISDLVETRGVFSAKEALQIAAGVAEALAYAGTQAPLIIRNLKPQNIRIDESGNLKITDFSLAIVAHDPEDGPSIDGDDLVGTPNFVSPEHAAGSPEIDQRSDMYSLGMVLYYATTRKAPFDTPDPFKTFELQRDGQLPNPREINPALPQTFVAFLARLTMKDPQNRYDTWGDVLADAKRILSGKPVSVRQLPPSAKASIVLKNTAMSGGAPVSTPEAGAVPGKAEKRRAHPVAWVVLILWLAWLANCRLMNPLHLPDTFAPAISIPAVDALLDKATRAGGTASAEEPAPAPARETTEPRQLRQIPPNPYAKLAPPRTPTSGDPLEDRARPQPQPAPASTAAPAAPVPPPPAAQPAPAEAQPAPAEAQTVATLAHAIGTLVAKGDFEAAKAKCEAIGTPEAKAAAAILASLPSPDEAVGEAILAKKGESLTLTYMGKPRTVTPVRVNGSAIIVKFADQSGLTREIAMATAKIDAAQKIAFLNSWAETPVQHAAAAVAALQAGDFAAARRHAADAGPLAAILAGALTE